MTRMPGLSGGAISLACGLISSLLSTLLMPAFLLPCFPCASCPLCQVSELESLFEALKLDVDSLFMQVGLSHAPRQSGRGGHRSG